jgi:hypothetical protein
MSKLETNTIDTISGSTNLTLGGTNATDITIPSGVTLTNNGTASGFGVNTPAFLATNSANQSLSDDTMTKVQFNTEVYDTASAYDNVTNYRFTVPSGQGGKYAVYSKIIIDSEVNSNLDGALIEMRKNNSSLVGSGNNEVIFLNNPIRLTPLSVFAAVQLNAGDYLEVYCRIEANDATGGRVNANGNFGAYKLIE